jgi:hypothetical protein
MVELSVIRDLVAIFGVVAGFSYYVLTVRNANRARKQALVREFAEKLGGYEGQMIYMELLQMEWEDFDDYIRKYDSTVNADNYAKRGVIWGIYNRMGFEVYRGSIDIGTVYDLMGYQGLWFFWHKFKPIIYWDRERYGSPDNFQWFEYLYNEMKNERIRRGFPADPIDYDGYTEQ